MLYIYLSGKEASVAVDNRGKTSRISREKESGGEKIMKLLNVSISPHIRSNESTTKIMLDVIIALLPAIGVGIYVFKWDALIITLISVSSCVATEYVY